ncbi:hypothetical protein P7K49_014362 [Saguinus oedipus]|uniref:Uncharacterized protein n=1 Tax=Saguinus oedipus TaxID=9490 RepID=A0ABQ9VIY4_SAGOE|nr:hypothetical protein P7K49_014362 [Saguinus oedipus]
MSPNQGPSGARERAHGVGRPRRGFRGKACPAAAAFRPLSPPPAPPLATYPAADGKLCRCWRRLYSPDAASEPSLAAMARGSRLEVSGAAATAWCRSRGTTSEGRRGRLGPDTVTGRPRVGASPALVWSSR